MVKRLKQMLGEEYMIKILAGEKDFSGIELQRGFNLSGHDGFAELQNYLKSRNNYKEPIIISGSKFQYIMAKGLHLPYAIAKESNFEGANLERIFFEGADLRGANLKRTDIEGAYLGRADIRNAKNLDNCFNLSYAIFHKTVVNEKERKIIEKSQKQQFIVEDIAHKLPSHAIKTINSSKIMDDDSSTNSGKLWVKL